MSSFASNSRVTPFLWFATEAKQAADLYTSVFPNSKILQITPAKGMPNPPSEILTVDFELDGTRFIALNGGAAFKFTEAVSFVIRCENQQEIDHYWQKLIQNGGSEGQCGWLKDPFGLSWQVIPARLPELMSKPQGVKALMGMKKIVIADLERANVE